MAQIPKGGTLVPGGVTFPVVREAVYAADLTALNAMDSSQLYLGMLGITASTPGVFYTLTSLSPLTWTQFTAATTPLRVKDTVLVASTANRALSGLAAIDGVSLVAGDRVLLKNQTTTTQNGIYIASAGAWTRATDFDTPTQTTVYGATIPVLLGTTQAATLWYVSAPTSTVIIGTTVLTFTQVAAFQPTPLLPAPIATTGARGTALNYARGDHVHAISAATLQTLAFAWTNTHSFASTVNLNSTVNLASRLQFGSQTIVLNSISQTITLTAPFIKVSTPSLGFAINRFDTAVDGTIIHVLNTGSINISIANFGGGNIAGFRVLQPGEVVTYLYDGTVSANWKEVLKAFPTFTDLVWVVSPTLYTSNFTVPIPVDINNAFQSTYRIDPTGGPIFASNPTSFGGSGGRQLKFTNVSASTNPITIQLQNGINVPWPGVGTPRQYVMNAPYQSVTLEKQEPGDFAWHVVAESFGDAGSLNEGIGPLLTVVGVAQTISPKHRVNPITAGALDSIATINPLYTGFTGTCSFIAMADTTFVTGGNIAKAVTVLANTVQDFFYNGTSWYPKAT